VIEILKNQGYDSASEEDGEIRFFVSIDERWGWNPYEASREYEEECDEHEKKIKSILPPGWEFEWEGNHDSNGESIEEVCIYPT